MLLASPSSAVVTRAVDLLTAAGVRVVPTPNVTYYVVVPFTRDGNGMVVPGEAKEAPNGEAARRRAAAIAATEGNVGAVAFSRTGDPDSGEFSEGVVLASFGEGGARRAAGVIAFRNIRRCQSTQRFEDRLGCDR